MYVRMYVCMYVRTYVCICVCMYVRVNVCNLHNLHMKTLFPYPFIYENIALREEYSLVVSEIRALRDIFQLQVLFIPSFRTAKNMITFLKFLYIAFRNRVQQC